VCALLSAPCSGQVLAFKALLAADTLFAKSRAASNKGTLAKGLASGSYTFWSDSPVGIGTSTTDVNTTSFQGCLNACDHAEACAAVAMTGVTAANATITACQLIEGDDTIATFKRSVTKVVTSRLTLPGAATGKLVSKWEDPSTSMAVHAMLAGVGIVVRWPAQRWMCTHTPLQWCGGGAWVQQAVCLGCWQWDMCGSVACSLAGRWPQAIREYPI